MLIIIGIIVWLACALIVAGYSFAHFQARFPEIAKEQHAADQWFCFSMAFLFGPIALLAWWIVGLLHGENHFDSGWRLK